MAALPISARLLLLTLVAMVTGGVSGGVAPQCPPGSARHGNGMLWFADPDDCSKFVVCHGGRKFDFDCGANVWDPETKTCVGKGSIWDKCTIAKELDELNHVDGKQGGSNAICRATPGAVFAKMDNCAQYFDCSSDQATVDADPHVRECTYPLLFDAEAKKCAHHATVKCGDRSEPKEACDYKANQCEGRSHCVPCNVRFPSCRGLPDGLNPWVGREYSPFYVLCEKERPLYQGMCDNSRGTQLFHPLNRVCTEMKKEDTGM